MVWTVWVFFVSEFRCSGFQSSRFGCSSEGERKERKRTLWMAQLELDEHPAGEGREDAQEDDKNDAWSEAHDGQTGWERQYAWGFLSVGACGI